MAKAPGKGLVAKSKEVITSLLGSKTTLPDLRSEPPRTDARNLMLVAYDPATNRLAPLTVGALIDLIGPRPDPGPPKPDTSDDLPLASDHGIRLATDKGEVLAGDIRKST